ncbi:MAG: hypothetical protein AVDCRST_MAG73-2012, partial [uncultured Thermomicrobiales bacterium]
WGLFGQGIGGWSTGKSTSRPPPRRRPRRPRT